MKFVLLAKWGDQRFSRSFSELKERPKNRFECTCAEF